MSKKYLVIGWYDDKDKTEYYKDFIKLPRMSRSQRSALVVLLQREARRMLGTDN